MAELSKEELRTKLLDQVGKWFDSASQPESNDHRLVIERSNFIRNKDRQVIGSSFTVRAELDVGIFTVPVETSHIVSPH